MGEVHGIDPPSSGGAGPGPSWPSDQFTSGDPDVDVVLARLARLTDTSVAEQPELYSEISESLLAELDQGRQEAELDQGRQEAELDQGRQEAELDQGRQE